ncbi:MAG: adenylosuccinate synthase [Candidatus Promineifilaceae bacterium]
MPLNIIVGAQWGDEGKGHITYLLAAEAEIVARFSGGDNAGHTVTVGDQLFKLHLIPSGILHSRPLCLIGSGVVVNPAVLLREMAALDQRGIDVSPGRLQVSGRAHLLTPAHVALDQAQESARQGEALGTTLRGIGPAYKDKSARLGVRAALLTAGPEEITAAIGQHISAANRTLGRLWGAQPFDCAEIVDQFLAFAERLTPYISDTGITLRQALQAQHTVLAEGAQGTLLDLDHGTYPFVTSASTTAGGALTGLGVGPNTVGRVIGVAKAFTSRVGAGPFPTEAQGETAKYLRGTGAQPWDEFGTTTGRPRRVGWLDLVGLRYAASVNGLTELAITKLDILSGLERIPVCEAYELDGNEIAHIPMTSEELGRCRPRYVHLRGWQEEIGAARGWDELPPNARRCLEFVAERVGLPISLVSIGPRAEQVIRL